MLRTLTRDFCNWWCRELGALVPARIQAWQAARRPLVHIQLRPREVRVERREKGQSTSFVDGQPLDDFDDKAWAELTQLCADARVQLSLAPSEQHRLRLTLPIRALAKVDDAIRYQLTRESPVEPEYLLWTRQLAGRMGKHCEIDVTLVRTARAAALQERFAAHGLARPAIVTGQDSDWQVLLPGEDGSMSDKHRRDRRAVWVALALLASIPLSSLMLLSIRQNDAQGQLQQMASAAGERGRSAARVTAAAEGARALQQLVQSPRLSGWLSTEMADLSAGTEVEGLSFSRSAGAELKLLLPAGTDISAMEAPLLDAAPRADGRIAATLDLSR